MDSFSDHGIYTESVYHSGLVVLTYCSLQYLIVDLSKFPLFLELCLKAVSLLKIRRKKSVSLEGIIPHLTHLQIKI